MDKIPEQRDARLAFLGEWATEQQRRLAVDEQRRRHPEQFDRADEQRRLYAEAIVRVVTQARERIGQMDSVKNVAVVPVVVTKPSDLPVDRAAVFADLIVRLREYKWADPIVSECDEPRYIAPQAIDIARRHCPDAPWLLYMEDDVILGPDFGLLPGLLREADELFPDTGIVSFFSWGFGEPGWSIHPMEEFAWLQCAAIRNTDQLAGFRSVVDDTVTQSAGKELYGLPDRAIRTFRAVEYDAYALWCPSLVQHAKVTSTFFTLAERPLSWSYMQAYGQAHG